MFAGLDHQDLPLEEVVAPDRVDRKFPTVLFTVVAVRGAARIELHVRVAENRIDWEYSTEATIRRWDAAFHAVLARLVKASGTAQNNWIKGAR